MIRRSLRALLEQHFADKKALIILGARQVGKTTLVKNLVAEHTEAILWLSGDESDIRILLADATSTRLKALIGQHKIVVIDEAQRIENIGLCAKLIIDHIEGVKLILTGSSSFELSNKLNEPLTGRKWEYTLFPLSFGEMVEHHGLLTEKRLLSHRLIYGYYPDVVINQGQEQSLLLQLADSYLYKDLLAWQQIQKPEKIERLLQALAFQVGQVVSYRELGQVVGLDNETVERYIQLLEKSLVIFRLSSLSRNLRNELKKSRKIYFYDNGIRNAIIKQFAPLALRNDVGALWENYFISERKKWLHYNQQPSNCYFWRTVALQEIDYIEEWDGQMTAYELKWNPKKKVRFPKTFEDSYLPKSLQVVTPENYDTFLIGS